MDIEGAADAGVMPRPRHKPQRAGAGITVASFVIAVNLTLGSLLAAMNYASTHAFAPIGDVQIDPQPARAPVVNFSIQAALLLIVACGLVFRTRKLSILRATSTVILMITVSIATVSVCFSLAGQPDIVS